MLFRSDEEIQIYHYDDPTTFRGPIKEFVREIEEQQQKTVKFIHMKQFSEIPKEV